MKQIYVSAEGGVMDLNALTATGQVLTGLAADQDAITFTQDADGPHFLVPDDLHDAFLAAVNAAPAKKRGRPRRNASPDVVDETPEDVADAAAELETSEIELGTDPEPEE